MFAENMDRMHLLSSLLTADPTKAEECCVSGVEDRVEGSDVFRDWAQSWARRTIVQNAIRMFVQRENRSASQTYRVIRSAAVSDERRMPITLSGAFSGLKTSSALCL